MIRYISGPVLSFLFIVVAIFALCRADSRLRLYFHGYSYSSIPVAGLCKISIHYIYQSIPCGGILCFLRLIASIFRIVNLLVKAFHNGKATESNAMCERERCSQDGYLSRNRNIVLRRRGTPPHGYFSVDEDLSHR
jgi:TRAP-type C4-dicarboxylate transport system permease small subunit